MADTIMADLHSNDSVIVRCLTKEGYDKCIGVNHLGHFLLTNLLLDKLKECAPSRIITVSWRGEGYATEKDFSVALEDADYEPQRMYFKSKAANIMFARYLGCRLLPATGVMSYSVEPGLTYTNIFQNNLYGPRFEWLFMPIMWWVKHNFFNSIYRFKIRMLKGFWEILWKYLGFI